MSQCFLYNDCSHVDCDKKFCLRKYKVDYLYNHSLLSFKQRDKTVLTIDSDGTDLAEFNTLKTISTNMIEFTEQGSNLFIHSAQCGNGKTSWAIRLVQNYFDDIWPTTELKCRAIFIHVPTFLQKLKANISAKNDYIEFINNNIADADLVIWDDIAAKNGTEFELDNLLSLIDMRIMAGKSNVYTSNKSKTEMYSILGERLTSRICNYSYDIELHGKDKRGLAMGGGIILNGQSISNIK